MKKVWPKPILVNHNTHAKQEKECEFKNILTYNLNSNAGSNVPWGFHRVGKRETKS